MSERDPMENADGRKGEPTENVQGTAEGKARRTAGLIPWKPGQSGNPGGMPKGLRHKKNRALEALLDAFEEMGGKDYAMAIARREPVAFLRCLVSLLPREVEQTGERRVTLNLEASDVAEIIREALVLVPEADRRELLKAVS